MAGTMSQPSSKSHSRRARKCAWPFLENMNSQTRTPLCRMGPDERIYLIGSHAESYTCFFPLLECNCLEAAIGLFTPFLHSFNRAFIAPTPPRDTGGAAEEIRGFRAVRSFCTHPDAWADLHYRSAAAANDAPWKRQSYRSFGGPLNAWHQGCMSG